MKISDEAVEAAYDALTGDIDKAKMRAVLEAAAPYLMPGCLQGSGRGAGRCGVKISDEAVEAAQKAWTKAYWTEATPGKADWMHAALAAAVPYLMPDREALAEILAMKMSLVRFSDEESDRMIELTMREAWPLAYAAADSVLALIGGSEVPGDQPS